MLYLRLSVSIFLKNKLLKITIKKAYT